ncbi:MAG: DUF4249 family protein [Imperialibacter sp.]|uniref:DUF4249 family protein n=1 Tax=Imperialibacter roseus TaxID=1324217 RepID=A0ABZ0IQA8_9BACT|nr:DUF4249 family protein [Imperialibacter roseus]WOK07232.1 DUF4249 family protein [Imperialibacter roseus]
MKILKDNLLRYLFAVSIATIAFSCQKEIMIPQPDYTGKVSIEGIMEPDSLPLVYLFRTVPYLTGSTNPSDLVIRDAIVKISSVDGTDVLHLDSVYSKLDCRYNFYYKGNVKTKTNVTYKLEVVDGEKIYEATTSTTLSKVTIDSVTYTSVFQDLYGEHEGVITYFNDIPGEDNFYRYEMYRAVDSTVKRGEKKLYGSCLAGDTIMFTELGRSVYNDLNLAGQQISIVAEPALSHNYDSLRGYVVGYVRIQSIDKATYNFYDQTDRQKLGVYNPFVEPLFLKEGQFGKDAFGFFGSMVRSDSVYFVYPE